MATQIIEARTLETGKSIGERVGKFFSKVEDIAWRVSFEVQPLLRGFVPPYRMECLTSEHLSYQEKMRIKAGLPSGF